MADAQARNEAQQRPGLLARLKKLPQDRLVKYVEENGLPSTTSKWTFEQLKGAVEAGEAPVEVEAEGGEEAGQQYVIGHLGKEQFKVVAVSSDEEANKASEDMGDGWITYIISEQSELHGIPDEILLGIVNLAKGSKVRKFASHDAALSSAFASLAKAAELQAGPPEKPAPKAATAKKTAAPKEPKAPKLINYEPKAKDQIKQVKAGTKIATLIDLLAQENGTTIEEIEAELSKSGKAVSARAWLGYDLHTVAGYGVRQDGDNLFLVLPKGMKEPLEHKVPEPPKPPVKKAAAAKTEEAPAAAAEEEVEVEVAAEPTPAPTPAKGKPAAKQASKPATGKGGKSAKATA